MNKGIRQLLARRDFSYDFGNEDVVLYDNFSYWRGGGGRRMKAVEKV